MGEFDFEKLDREVDDLLADVKGLLDEPEEDGAELDDPEEDETEPEDAEDDARRPGRRRTPSRTTGRSFSGR